MADNEPTQRTCADCRFGLFQDVGYSSYTVEGTEFYCMVNAHPEQGFDVFYGEDKRINFAVECPKFDAGESIDMDVDYDRQRNLTPQQKAIYDAWDGPVPA